LGDTTASVMCNLFWEVSNQLKGRKAEYAGVCIVPKNTFARGGGSRKVPLGEIQQPKKESNKRREGGRRGISTDGVKDGPEGKQKHTNRSG